MLAALLQLFVMGSYNSALGSGGSLWPFALVPPATSTRPSRSVVTECSNRGTLMDPAKLHPPVWGSYISAELSGTNLIPSPPTIRTLPSSRTVDLWNCRGSRKLPVEIQVPSVGSYTSALLRTIPDSQYPPATRTLPFGRRSWIWLKRGHRGAAVTVQALETG